MAEILSSPYRLDEESLSKVEELRKEITRGLYGILRSNARRRPVLTSSRPHVLTPCEDPQEIETAGQLLRAARRLRTGYPEPGD